MSDKVGPRILPIRPAEAAQLAERAVMLDPGDARALTLAGHVRGFLSKRPQEASALHERAIALNPNLALAWCFSGLAHSYLGLHDEAPAPDQSGGAPVAIRSARLLLRHVADHAPSDAGRLSRRGSTPGGGRSRSTPTSRPPTKAYLSALGMSGRPRETQEGTGPSARARTTIYRAGGRRTVAAVPARRYRPLCRGAAASRPARRLRRLALITIRDTIDSHAGNRCGPWLSRWCPSWPGAVRVI